MIKLSVLFSVKNFPKEFDGISAAADFVGNSKVNLYTLPATGDMYEIGFVRDTDMQTLIELTSSVGINLNFEW